MTSGRWRPSSTGGATSSSTASTRWTASRASCRRARSTRSRTCQGSSGGAGRAPRRPCGSPARSTSPRFCSSRRGWPSCRGSTSAPTPTCASPTRRATPRSRKGSRAWTPRSASCCRLGPLGGEPDEARRLVRRARAAPEGLGRVPRPQAAPQGDPRLRKARGARERRVQGDAEDRRGGGEGNLRGQGASVGQEAARVVPPRGRGQWRPRLRPGRHGGHVHRDPRRDPRLLQRRRTGGWADRRRWPADDRRRVEDDGRSVLQPHERIAAVRLTPRPMAARYLEPRLERSSRAEMTRLQTRRFKEQLRHAYAHSPFYCRKLKAAGVTPAAIRTLDDLRKLPFTTKDELKENPAVKPPWGDGLALPFADVLRVHMASATTGRPLAFLDTREDWHGFYHSYARSLYAYGIRRPDVVMAAFSYGPWIGYWSGFYAAQDLGCLVFPVGGLTTDQRIDALLSYPITVLGCTPSYALFLAEAAGKKGIDLAKQAKVRITWHTGEPGAAIPATKARIEAAFGAKEFDLPGLTEIAAWGFECDARAGLTHVHEDYCYPEILDEQGRPVGPGGRGEPVLTSLYRKAMPLIRYSTPDLRQLADRTGPCGRTLQAPEDGVLARLDDMRKIRGIIVYPRRIEELVRPHASVDEFQIVFRRLEGLDDVLIRIDPSPSLSRSEEHTSELQSQSNLVCRLLLEKKKYNLYSVLV